MGWILGLVTSVCELASFIEIYRIHKPKDSPRHIKDSQEALDASTISNLGMMVYLFVSK